MRDQTQHRLLPGPLIGAARFHETAAQFAQIADEAVQRRARHFDEDALARGFVFQFF